MWDTGDVDVDAHTAPSKPSVFTLDDAFSEDDGLPDAALEFNPAAIRAALARTLASEALESADSQNGVGDGGGSTGASGPPPDLSSSNHHDRNGSEVKLEDPDASVSTLDINAPPTRPPGRAPGEWSRSTSYSRGYGYRQDSQDTTSGMESLASFSRISLSDSAHELEPVEVSLGLSEEMVGEGKDEEAVEAEDIDDGAFRTVRIDISRGGKPRVEEFVVVPPEFPSPRTLDRDETGMPSPDPPLSPPPKSPSNDHHNTYMSPSVSILTSNVSQNNPSQSRSVPQLSSQTAYRSSDEDHHTRGETNRIPPDSTNTTLSSNSLGSPPSMTTTIPQDSSQPRLSGHGGHRHSRSVGPSTLDKVMSRTRPNFLPPKPKTEDLKHMADWEAMMKRSRVVGEFRLLSVHSLPLLVFVFILREGPSVLTFSSFSVHP